MDFVSYIAFLIVGKMFSFFVLLFSFETGWNRSKHIKKMLFFCIRSCKQFTQGTITNHVDKVLEKIIVGGERQIELNCLYDESGMTKSCFEGNNRAANQVKRNRSIFCLLFTSKGNMLILGGVKDSFFCNLSSSK